MAVPFKRLCIRAYASSPRSLQQCRLISSSAPSNASPSSEEPSSSSSHSEDMSDLDALTSQPGVRYSVTTSTDSPSSLQRFKDTDMASRAHYELAGHRELREMMRLAAWEMPLLAQHAQPFHAPGKENFLRWRYTTYVNETHPASRKVVVEFNANAIPDMTPAQQLKLKKLAGPRLKEGNKIKMSCESFETVAQNKRYLADLINTLIAEAKNADTDSFEDVPLDLRHQKPRPRLSFPKEWRMTTERRAELDGKRREALLADGRRVEEGKMISGIGAIEQAASSDVPAVEEPLMVAARRALPQGKMGQKTGSRR